MRRRGLCGSGLIAEASAAVSRARVSTICWSISTCHVLGFFAGAVLDYSAGFSLPMPDAETSISDEPGARKGHAGICAGAVRATGRPTAMCAKRSLALSLQGESPCGVRTNHPLLPSVATATEEVETANESVEAYTGKHADRRRDRDLQSLIQPRHGV